MLPTPEVFAIEIALSSFISEQPEQQTPTHHISFNQEGKEIKPTQPACFKYTVNILTHITEISYPNLLIVSASSTQ